MSRELPVFVLALRPDSDVDGIRALRAALKVLRNRFGLRVVKISKPKEVNAVLVTAPIAGRHRRSSRSAGGKARAIS